MLGFGQMATAFRIPYPDPRKLGQELGGIIFSLLLRALLPSPYGSLILSWRWGLYLKAFLSLTTASTCQALLLGTARMKALEISVGDGGEKLKFLGIVDGIQNGIATVENKMGTPPPRSYFGLPCDPTINVLCLELE